MQFSEKSLREWVNPTVDIQKICKQLTVSGLEVEKIEKKKLYTKNIIIGKIVHIKDFFKKNNFFILSVSIKKGKKIDAFCKNIKFFIGQKVAVALEGTSFFERKVKKILRKNKKVFFEGFICSFKDLNDFSINSNLINFPDFCKCGNNINQYLSAYKDTLITLNIPYNRVDLSNVLGIAREVAILNSINIPFLKKEKKYDFIIKKNIVLESKLQEKCVFYVSRILRGINITEASPLWLQEKLDSFNVISSNNFIKDIIFCTFVEVGYFVHIFDFDKINGIFDFRMSNKKDFIVLENKKRFFFKSSIPILCDEEKVLSIKGLIHSDLIKVDKNTKNIIIGIASFSDFSLEKNLEQFFLLKKSCSSFLERGVNINFYNSKKVIDYVVGLFLRTNKNIKISNFIKKEFFKKKNRTVFLFKKSILKKIGFFIDEKKINNILKRSGFLIQEFDCFWKLTVPFWRLDILIEEDVINDIIRFYGYKKIPSTSLKCSFYKKNFFDFKKNKKEKEISSFLVHTGFNEIITYSFVDPILQDCLFSASRNLFLKNPISRSMSVMRKSLLVGLLNAVSYNQNRQNSFIRLFEKGLCFIPSDKKTMFPVKQDLYLSFVMSGERYNRSWNLGVEEVDFYDLKGNVESILEISQVIEFTRFKKEKFIFLHPYKSMGIYLFNKFVGFIGMLHPALEKVFQLKSSVFLFEIQFKKLFYQKSLKYTTISKFPISKRDICITISNKISFERVLKVCRSISSNLVTKVLLFDIYRDFKKNKNSLAISFFFQGHNKMITDKEISNILSACLFKLQNKFGAFLRK